MAYEIRSKKDASVVHYYEANTVEIYGGPWGDANLYEHIEVPDRPAPEKSFGMKELLDVMIAKGNIAKADLPAEGRRIIDSR